MFKNEITNYMLINKGRIETDFHVVVYICIIMIRTFINRNVQPFTELKPFPSLKHVCNSPVWFRDFCYEAPFPV